MLAFRLQLKEPALDLRPRFYLKRIKGDPCPFTFRFLVKGHGITAYIDDGKPAVSDGAGREKLYGVRQTLGGFTDGIKLSFFGEVLVSQVYHKPADDYAGSGEAMKGPDPLDKFFKGVGTNIHVYLITPVTTLDIG